MNCVNLIFLDLSPTWSTMMALSREAQPLVVVQGPGPGAGAAPGPDPGHQGRIRRQGRRVHGDGAEGGTQQGLMGP